MLNKMKNVQIEKKIAEFECYIITYEDSLVNFLF